MASSNEPSSSSPTRPLCAVCNHRYSVYTCPGCSTRTCSLPCSSTHKARNACTGERNKAAFVPMNQYSWGTMMNDYAFLEELGRKVGDWGKEIVRGGFGKGDLDDGRGRGARGRNGRGRGRGSGRGGGGGGRAKRDVLKMQLDFRDIDMDLLPVGMERRKLNQSCWDFKNKTALLTIEFKFHCPPDPLLPPSQPQEPIFILLTHRNNIETPLLSLIQAHITERIKSKKNLAVPAWVKSLVCPHPDDPDSFTPPQCLMTVQVDPCLTLGSRQKLGYYRFDHSQKLSVLLRNTHFVEYPTIEIWEEFHGLLIDTQGTVTHPVEERKPKRRKLNRRAGKLAINGLLGGYGSDEEAEKAEEQAAAAADNRNVLSLLGGYMGSDDEEEASAANSDLDADAEAEDDDELELDPAVLLELMRQARGSERGEEDTIDWGDSDEESE